MYCQEQLSRRNKLAKPSEGDQSNKIDKGQVSIEFPDWVQVKEKTLYGKKRVEIRNN